MKIILGIDNRFAMDFSNVFHGPTGLIHFLFSILAIVCGTVVLIKRKGTKSHKQIGYVYSVSMFGVLVTSFMLYNLYSTFGVFHWFAILSSVTLKGGILPMYLKKPKSYITMHFNFMYWSLFGLYGALCAEVLVRIPDVVVKNGITDNVFYNAVGIEVFKTMGLGYVIMSKKERIGHSLIDLKIYLNVNFFVYFQQDSGWNQLETKFAEH